MRIDLGVIFARHNLRKHAHGPLGGLALVLLCCTVYLPGFFSIPPVDRDESRFAQASRQMFESVALPEAQRDAELHSGGLAVPMVGGKQRLNKPPLIYWLQGGSAAVFTGGDPLADAIWMYRVPSMVAGVVIVLATWRLGCSMFDPRVGWTAAALLGVAPVFVWEAHQARADMVMVAWTTLAMGQLWRIWRRSDGARERRSDGARERRTGHGLSRPLSGPLSSLPLRRARRERVGERAPCSPSSTPSLPSTPSLRLSVSSSLPLWLFTALGILTKGPITPMIVLLAAVTLAVLSRSGKSPGPGGRAFQPAGFRWLLSLHPLLGLLIAAAAVAPWVYAVAQQVGFASYWQIVSDEVFGRAGSAKEGHWGPPGYHLVLLVVLFWPGSLLTGLSIGRAWRRGLGRIEGKRSREEKRGREEKSRRKSPLPNPLPPGAGEGAGGILPNSSRRGSVASSLRRSVASSLSTLRSLRITRRPEAFLLAWMLPSWLVFELVGTKLPHYTMPLYPAVALITARGLFAAMGAALPGVERPVNRVGFAVWCVPGVLITIGLGAAAYSSLGGHWNERPPAWLLWGLQFVSLGAVGLAIGALRRRAWLGAYACGIVVSLCMSVGLLGGYLPRVDRVWFTTILVNKATAADGGPIAASGFNEDSLTWLTRGRIELIEKADEGAWWREHPDGVMILPERHILRSHSVIARVEGFRYTKGRRERLAVVKWWRPQGGVP